VSRSVTLDGKYSANPSVTSDLRSLDGRCMIGENDSDHLRGVVSLEGWDDVGMVWPNVKFWVSIYARAPHNTKEGAGIETSERSLPLRLRPTSHLAVSSKSFLNPCLKHCGRPSTGFRVGYQSPSADKAQERTI
jgi:hypothetical protein